MEIPKHQRLTPDEDDNIEVTIPLPFGEMPKQIWDKNKYVVSASKGVLKGPIDVKAIRSRDGSLRFNFEVIVVK